MAEALPGLLFAASRMSGNGGGADSSPVSILLFVLVCTLSHCVKFFLCEHIVDLTARGCAICRVRVGWQNCVQQFGVRGCSHDDARFSAFEKMNDYACGALIFFDRHLSPEMLKSRNHVPIFLQCLI
jgi:hypothetical protein